MKPTRSKLLVLSLAVIVLAGIAARIVAKSGGAKDGAGEIAKNAVRLNEVLTNEMSDTEGLKGLDSKVRTYMQQWELKGAQLSIMRNDSLLYAKGYGWADEENDVKMSPSISMRVASVSKLLTAAGIMVLKDRGEISLQDKVFGPEGILNDSTFTLAITDKRHFNITVEDLLRHKGGFSGFDPMFNTRTIMMQNHLRNAPDNKTLTRLILRRRLKFDPGTSQSYSNFGFMLLSEIIEKISGEPYEDFMQKNVLYPAGCFDMHIAYNYYKDKYPGEARYYVPSNEELVDEYNNSGRKVIRCYGGNDIRALAGAGAWVTSTPELARFVASIDGRPGVPDILSAEAVKEMVEYFDENTFSLGWNDTHPEKGWSRTGTFSGTTALVKYFPDGECWIFVSNNSTWKGPNLAKYTSGLFNTLRQRYSSELPKQDLFNAKETSSKKSDESDNSEDEAKLYFD